MSRRAVLYTGIALGTMAAAMMIGGCQDRQADTGEASADAPPPAAEVVDAGPSAVVEEARRDLAERLGRPLEDIKLLEARPVYWRTAALGCPEPDMSYAQVLTRGWLIRLLVGRAEYRYHSGENGPPFTCHPRQAEKPVPYSVD